ncbi:hypothetical protein BDF22DRAFT_654309 [Syncephalis plumigaleata]|nr:hypothetical protein BDF22DRAFT_654309 [Syncephalis plumigaleata]
MSQKVHAKSPLLGKHSNNAEDEGVLTVHYSTAAGNYCSQRPNSTLLDGQSNMRASTSANEIPVEDDSWVGGRRPEKRRRDTIFGYILLIIALAMFTAQTEATNVLQTRSYRKPYFILWVVHSALSLILPVQLAFEYWTSSSLRRYVSRIQRAISNLHGVSPVCATAIRVIKVLAVLLSIGGVAYMSFADSHRPDDSTKLDAASITSHNDTFVGDLVALGSAIIVGLYQVMYRHYAVPRRHNSLHFVNTMVGLMGVFTLLVCWIPIPILHWAGWERFEWPDAGAWGWIAGKPVTLAMALGSTGILLGFGLLISTSWKEEATYRAEPITKLSDDT